MTAMRSVHAILAAVTLWLAGAASASPLFEDRATNLWIGTPEGQQLIPLTANRWLDGYLESGQPVQALVAPDQALVNGLPFSSQPMQANQPAVSVIGLGEPVATVGGGPVSPPALQVWPESGRYGSTVAVEIGLAPAQFDAPSVALRIRRNAGPVREVVFCARSRPAGCVEPVALREGYRGLRETLAINAVTDYEIEARRANASVIASLSRRYEISGTDPRRDSDGDGIPDILEEILGLDAFRDDLQQDRDGDGWSDFDEWLRCPAYDAEMRCPALDDPDARPVDTDGDGWSDFDEMLRGTRAEARYTLSSLALAPREGETPESAAYRDRQLRFFERPAARRLYEREYQLDAVPLRPRAGVSGRFVHAAAQSLFGDKLEPLDQRVDAALLAEAGLVEGDLAPPRLRSSADSRLLAEAYPITRLPASEGLMLEAWQRQARQMPEPGVHIQVSKRALPPLADLTLQDFLALPDPVWTDVAGFRGALVAWLEATLSVDTDAPLSADSTRVGLALEQIFSEEARLNAAASPVVFNDSLTPVKRAWLPRMLDTLDAEAAPGGGLQRLLEQLALALRPMGALMDVAAFIDEQTAPDAVPVGRYSDIWLAGRWNDSGAGLPENCVLPDVLFDALDGNAAAAAAAGCPQFISQSQRAQQFAADRARRFALRSLLLLAPAELLADPGLRDPDADSDGDGLSNAAELEQRPLRFASRPDRADSDGDTRADADDPCPLDPVDACLGAVIRPQLQLPAQVTVRRGGPGGVAAIPVALSRVAEVPVEIGFEVLTAPDDTAVPGVDYTADTGTVSLRPGSQLVILSLPIPPQGSGDERHFSVQVTTVTGANAPQPLPRVRVQLLAEDVEPPPPEARIAAPARIETAATACLDGRGSLDPLGQGLAYAWTQASGPAVTLDGADTALACFTAPDTDTVVSLVFQLLVTDAEGREADAEATVQVDPPAGNRPPEVAAPLRFTLAQGEERSVNPPELRAQVSDPDGDPVTPQRLLGQAEGTKVILDDDGLRLRAFAGQVALLPEPGRVNRIIPVGDRHLVLVQERETAPFGERLWLYDVEQERLNNLLGSGASSVLGSPRSPVFYFVIQGSDGERRLLRQDLGLNGSIPNEVDAAAADGADNGRIDPRNGDLYYCHRDPVSGAGVFARLSVFRTTPTLSEFFCDVNSSGGGASAGEVVTDLGFCFDYDGVVCGTGDDRVVSRLEQPFDRIRQLSSGNGRLRIIEERFTGDLWFWEFAPGDSAIAPLAQVPALAYVEGSRLEVGVTTHFALVTDPFAPPSSLQVFRWPNGIGQPPEPVSETVERSDFNYGGFATDSRSIYWHRIDLPRSTTGNDRARLFRVDPAEVDLSTEPEQLAPFRLLSEEPVDGRNHVDFIVHDGRGVLVQRGLPVDQGNGRCALQRVDDSGATTPVLDVTACQFDLPRVYAFELRDPFLILREPFTAGGGGTVQTLDGPAFEGETGFAIEFADPEGATVELPVELEITAP